MSRLVSVPMGVGVYRIGGMLMCVCSWSDDGS